MSKITINYQDEKIILPLRNHTLSLQCLKEYFPLANSLVYDSDSGVEGLSINDGEISIAPLIIEYRVHCNKEQSPNDTSTNTDIHKDYENSSPRPQLHGIIQNNVEMNHFSPSNMSRDSHIKKYFEEDYSYDEIRSILAKHERSMSYRHLQRIVKNVGLQRKNKSEDYSEILSAIVQELNGSGSCLGYKALWKRLKLNYKLDVYRSTVLDILRVLDPEGIKQRCRYRLKRREYCVLGPNFIWHLDGYDKLKQFGFPIHGCVDGFSRKVLWLELATTNNNPKVICHFYLETIKKLKLIPTLIRSDHGTENSEIEIVHQAFRSQHNDHLSRVYSFIKGKSTANQRIESFWGRLRKMSIDFWMNYFKDMRDAGEFDKGKPMQVECLRFCFAPLIKYDLELVMHEWNRHSIRKQKSYNVKYGKPNYLYYHAEDFEVNDYGQNIPEEYIDSAMELFAQKPIYCSETFLEMVNDVFPDITIPTTVPEARNLYHHILSSIEI